MARRFAFLLFGFLAAILSSSFVMADVEDSQNCSGGSTNVAFADGNTLATVCVDQGGGMTDTVPDPSVTETVDPNNMDCDHPRDADGMC